MKELMVFPNQVVLIDAAVELFIQTAAEAIDRKGVFSVALSGGSTPEPLYRALAEPDMHRRLDWDRIHLFWGDERQVPPDHPESNFRMVNDTLINNIVIPAENVHRVPAELEPEDAAFRYEKELRKYFSGEWPQFDLVLLGMGKDGHTASLFPHSPGLREEERWFIANLIPEQKVWRLSLSKNAINAADTILVLVQGSSKAAMLLEVLQGPYEPEDKPVQLIDPEHGRMIWLVDEPAASLLPPGLKL